MVRASHRCCSAAVSSGSTATVTACSSVGLAARAKASARSVGLCSLETRTTARTPVGSALARVPSPISSSRATEV